jgi:hypothetical protein
MLTADHTAHLKVLFQKEAEENPLLALAGVELTLLETDHARLTCRCCFRKKQRKHRSWP